MKSIIISIKLNSFSIFVLLSSFLYVIPVSFVSTGAYLVVIIFLGCKFSNLYRKYLSIKSSDVTFNESLIFLFFLEKILKYSICK